MNFSVLMSVYCGDEPIYLEQSLDSLFNQTVMPDEIVIIKDGKLTTGLDAVLFKYAQKCSLIRFVELEKNSGLGVALRDGVISCKYDWIARMDADDVCVPKRFEEQIKFIENNPEVVLLGSWIYEFSKSIEKPDTATRLPLNTLDIKRYAKRRNPFRHMTVFMNKNAVLDCGNYRFFPLFEDYDLWLRILKKGYQAANVPKFLVNVRADEKMFKRRGGIGYLLKDLNFQKYLFAEDYISFYEFASNVLIRTCIRLLPNKFRMH